MQPYVKQDWEDLVTIINKSRLSHIEEGIYRISLVQPEKGEAGKDGITPQFRVANGYIQVSVDSGNTFNDLVALSAITGPQGATGKAFSIYKTYASVSSMEAAASEVPEGSFVLIASNEEDPDNAKLFVKNETGFTFLSDLSGAQGIQGERGQDGAVGITPAIVVHVKTLAAGEEATVEQSGSPEVPLITLGIPRGADGTNGQNGSDGVNGKNGYTFTPAVSPEGVLSWSNDGNLPNPEPIDIKGPKGDQGEKGENGENGSDGVDGKNGYTFTPAVSPEGVLSWSNDGNLHNPEPVDLKGPKGDQGEKGENGRDGVDGKNGSDGVNSKNGYTFTPAVDENANLSWTNNGGLENPPTVNIAPDLSDYVKYQEFVAGASDKQRKTIQLANADSISGISTTGTGANLIMMSQWDKVDIGSNRYQMNLNSPDGVVQINDEKVVATTQDVAEVDKHITTVESLSGNIYTMQSQISQLLDQVQQLKTPIVEPVEITEEGATVTQPEQDVSFSGTVAGVVGTITAKSIQSVNASITSGRLSASATNDVSIKGLVTTGDLQKSVSNAGLSVNTNEYVTITGADWQQTGYNAIEVGLSSAPKSVLIDGIDFKAAMGNNALSIFSWQENAVITISNCHFANVSNPLRLSNRDNKPCTINIVNCTCDKWAEGEYAGFICMQDYTSKSAQAAQEANQFGKLVINFVNCIAPDGTRITGNAEALYNKHQIYIYTDQEGLIPYDDGSRFPQVSAI